jgi:sulfur carrier protein
MVLTVNGERKDVQSTGIAGLLRELEYDGSHFAIAVNHGLVPRKRWGDTVLCDGDEVEILTPRQGG